MQRNRKPDKILMNKKTIPKKRDGFIYVLKVLIKTVQAC